MGHILLLGFLRTAVLRGGERSVGGNGQKPQGLYNLIRMCYWESTSMELIYQPLCKRENECVWGIMGDFLGEVALDWAVMGRHVVERKRKGLSGTEYNRGTGKEAGG